MFFGSVFTVEDTNNMPVTDGNTAMIGEDLDMIVITKEVVMGKLIGLKVDKSPGPDGMHPRVLKEMAREIANALVIILPEFNRLWGGPGGLEISKRDTTA